jgi:transposase
LEDLQSPEISEEIEFVPEKFVRKRHHRAKKKCRSCQKIGIASAPARVSEGCHYGPQLHAHVAVSKCADSIPLNRLEKRYARNGMIIDRSTLHELFHRVGDLLAPISRRILELIAQAPYVNADETPIFVQAPERCKKGYVWTFLSDKLIGYVFSEGRSGETPETILGNTQGMLQVDAYSGYNVVCMPNGRERVGCIAHIRRKFFAALKNNPEETMVALNYILELYKIEYEAARQNILGSKKHLAMRKTIGKEHISLP